MPSPHIHVESDGAVRKISIHRPEKKNALTVEMYQALLDALRAADADTAIKVVLLTGSDGIFTAGNDLSDFMNSPPASEDSPVLNLLMQLVDQQKPLVVAVDGVAIGIGTTLLLHADYVVASTEARFHMPFVNLGLSPEGGSSLLLPRAVGMARASEWLMFGEPIPVKAAKEAGLVNAVVHPGDLAKVALETAKKLAEKPLGSLLVTKRLLRDPLRDQVKQVILREGKDFIDWLSSPEAAEAFMSFFNRSK